GRDPVYGRALRDRPILAVDVTRHQGEPVVAVAAVDETTAAEAIELVDVVYEEIPAVMTIEEALAADAPLVHTAGPMAGHFSDIATFKGKPDTNVCHHFHYARGGAAPPLAPAGPGVDSKVPLPPPQPQPMEPPGAV